VKIILTGITAKLFSWIATFMSAVMYN
jgi:hypothetical protein